jgi:hypothetical protein
MDAGIAWDASKKSGNASNSMNTSRDATNRWDACSNRDARNNENAIMAGKPAIA